MKKELIRTGVLGLILLVMGLMCWFFRGMYADSPLEAAVRLNHVYKVTSDAAGNIYAVSDSRQTVTKLSKDGALVYRLKAHQKSERTLSNVNEIAPDDQGNLYVLYGVVDTNGSPYTAEELVKYTPDGTMDKNWTTQVFTVDTLDQVDGRSGSIKGLLIAKGQPYVYQSRYGSLKLIRADASGKQTEAASVPLDPGVYVSQAVGFPQDGGYFTTKRGELYAFNAAGSKKLRDAGQTGDAANLQFSYISAVKLDADGRRAMFLSGYGAEIRWWNPAAGSPESVRLHQSKLPGKSAGQMLNDFAVLPDGHLAVAADGGLFRIDPQGKAETFEYSGWTMFKRYVYWLGLAAAVIVALLWLKTVYWDLMPYSLIFKQVFVYIPVIIAASAILAVSIFYPLKNNMDEEVKRHLIFLAHDGEHMVDLKKLGQIDSPDDFMNDTYQEVDAGLSYRDHFAKFYHLLYRYENGKIYQVMDDDIDNLRMFESEPMNALVGIRSCIKRDELTGNWVPQSDYNALLNGEFLACDSTNANGSWMYALGPLMNDKGKLVGVYETGINTHALDERMEAIKRQVAWIIAGIAGLLMILFICMSFAVLSAIRRLCDYVRVIDNGQWDARVPIRSKDEVADLSERFNMLAGTIRARMNELRRTNEAYYRFVPQPILGFLNKSSVTDVRLGEQVETSMCILSANLHSFYEVAHRLDARQNFELVNGFFQRMGPLVRDSGGVIEQYADAGFTALFPNNPQQAVECAVRLCKEVAGWVSNDALESPMTMGIGLHYGPLILGIAGEEQRLAASVISDHVNVAGEVQRLSARLATQILVTEPVSSRAEGLHSFRHRYLGTVNLQGNAAMHLYDVFEGDDPLQQRLKMATLPAFSDGVSLFQQGRFAQARARFLEVIKQNRLDQPARLYFFLCDDYLTNGTKEGWNGSLIA